MGTTDVTISVQLAEEIWAQLKEMRDLWFALEAEPRASRITALLAKMDTAGMAERMSCLDDDHAQGCEVASDTVVQRNAAVVTLVGYHGERGTGLVTEAAFREWAADEGNALAG